MVIDSDSSTLEWGKIDSDGVTGSITVPEARYGSYEDLATAMSTQTLTDSEGVDHTLTVTYDSTEQTLTFDVSDADGGWWVKTTASAGFFAVIGHDSSTLMKSAPTTSSLTSCPVPSTVPTPLPTPASPSPSAPPSWMPTPVPSRYGISTKYKTVSSGHGLGDDTHPLTPIR